MNMNDENEENVYFLFKRYLMNYYEKSRENTCHSDRLSKWIVFKFQCDLLITMRDRQNDIVWPTSENYESLV